MNNKTIIAVILTLVVLGGVVYFVTKNEATEKAVSDQTSQSQTETPAVVPVAGEATETKPLQPTNSVVLSPTETGNAVTVQSATLTKPGFIVIYQVNSNSETKSVAHSNLLLPGTYNNLTIQLGTPIVYKQTIVAVLHEDNGDGEYTAADLYLGNPSQPVVSDVDVVDISMEDEDAVLQKQVERYLENNFNASTSASAN